MVAVLPPPMSALKSLAPKLSTNDVTARALPLVVVAAAAAVEEERTPRVEVAPTSMLESMMPAPMVKTESALAGPVVAPATALDTPIWFTVMVDPPPTEMASVALMPIALAMSASARA